MTLLSDRIIMILRQLRNSTLVSDVWGTIPQWFSFGAACAGVAIALQASRSWRNTLKAKRGDDLLTAIFDLVGAIGAMRSVLTRKALKSAYGNAVDRVYASFLEFEKAHVVASRSYHLDDALLLTLRSLIDEACEAGSLVYEVTHPSPSMIIAEHSLPPIDLLLKKADALREEIKRAVN